MYLPTTDLKARLIDARAYIASADSGTPSGGWSSLIGVITAICGNILISFALNTQRYAHLRLNRDREERLQKERKQARRKEQGTNYGTQQVEIAEARSRENAKAEPERYTLDGAGHDDERQALLPKLTPTRRSSTSSESIHPDEKGSDGTKENSYLKSPIWWLGISLMVVGEAGNFLAYGFAPASIVSPLGVVALISNCLIAPLLLGEQFRWRDAIGVCIAVAGCVVVVLSASESNPRLDPDAIWHLITRWEFETYLGITIFLIIVLSVASNKFGDKSILIDLGLVGLFGGYTALSTKGVASLLSNTIWRAITFPITYLLVAVLVFTAVMQIKYINRALQRFNATMVIPTQFVLFTLSVIIGSAVLYRDFEREQTDDAIEFVCGCALTFFGVWCITSGRNKHDDHEDDMDNQDDAISLVDEESVLPDIRVQDDKSTRRQSSVIVASASDRPGIRRLQSEPRDDYQRSAELATSASSTGEYTSLDDQLSQVPPGAASAVHTDTAAEMRLPRGDRDPKKPPPIHATTSAPLIPTAPSFQIGSLRPHTPLSRAPSSPATPSPTRHPQHHRDMTGGAPRYLEPNSPKRPMNRTSVSGFFPGPFTSPLSGSLSAMVADERRRGADSGTVRRKSIRTSSTRQDLSKPIFPTGMKRHSIASGEMDLGTEDPAELRAAADGSAPLGRTRSLSATLGDLFNSGRRPRRPDPQTPVHEAPSDGEPEGNTERQT